MAVCSAKGATMIDVVPKANCLLRFISGLNGKDKHGGIKAETVSARHELGRVIFDEYHYGAWRESAQELFEAEDKRSKKKLKARV